MSFPRGVCGCRARLTEATRLGSCRVASGSVTAGHLRTNIALCGATQDGRVNMTPSRRATGVGSLPGAVEAETVEVISLITPPASPAHDDVGTGSTPPPLFQPSVSPPPPPPAQNVAAAGSTPSHLVQPSIPPQSPLAAVAVARSPLLDIAPLRPIYLSPHSSDEDPTYDPSPASGRRRSVRGLRSGAADADPECNFCPGFSRTGGVMASELLGPFEARSKVGKGIMHLWVHEVCALWSPEVYLDPDTNAMLGVHKAYGRGRRLRCSECARIGPTVGCYVPSCRNVFHYLCIMAGRCHLVKDRHVILCERHKGEAASLEFKADMERIAAAAAAAVARKEAVAAACAGDPDAGKDTPHSQYTGLRRGETETIVSRAGGIAASPPDGKVVTVARRTRRVLGPGERLILGDRPMRVPTSVLESVLARLSAAVKAPSRDSPDKQLTISAQDKPRRLPVVLTRNLRQARVFRRGELRPSLPVFPASYDTTVVAPSSQPSSPPAALPVGKGKARAVTGGPGWRAATFATGGGGAGGGREGCVAARGPA